MHTQIKMLIRGFKSFVQSFFLLFLGWIQSVLFILSKCVFCLPPRSSDQHPLGCLVFILWRRLAWKIGTLQKVTLWTVVDLGTEPGHSSLSEYNILSHYFSKFVLSCITLCGPSPLLMGWGPPYLLWNSHTTSWRALLYVGKHKE